MWLCTEATFLEINFNWESRENILGERRTNWNFIRINSGLSIRNKRWLFGFIHSTSIFHRDVAWNKHCPYFGIIRQLFCTLSLVNICGFTQWPDWDSELGINLMNQSQSNYGPTIDDNYLYCAQLSVPILHWPENPKLVHSWWSVLSRKPVGPSKECKPSELLFRPWPI